MWKWQLLAGMEDTQKKQEAFAGEEDTSNDMLRTMILETNPFLLAITVVVSILHSVFDILAFKNDISFYKNKKSMEGLSLRSMVVNCFFSVVILLYLADNDTRYVTSFQFQLFLSFLQLRKELIHLAVLAQLYGSCIQCSRSGHRSLEDFKSHHNQI